MDSFFSFLEKVATSELESRNAVKLAEANAAIMAAQNGALYNEGQLVGGLPSWVLPVALVVGVGAIVYIAAK